LAKEGREKSIIRAVHIHSPCYDVHFINIKAFSRSKNKRIVARHNFYSETNKMMNSMTWQFKMPCNGCLRFANAIPVGDHAGSELSGSTTDILTST